MLRLLAKPLYNGYRLGLRGTATENTLSKEQTVGRHP